MEKIGVVCGRFQIFHKEHLHYLLSAKERCDYLLVGITSPEGATGHIEAADSNRGKKAANPCTFYERMCMIRNALVAAGVNREEFDIVPYPIEEPEKIRHYVPNGACHFITILDQWGECKKERIEKMGYPVIVLWKNVPKKISSSMIREKIRDCNEWKCYVPNTTYEYIQDQGIDIRIRGLFDGDRLS